MIDTDKYEGHTEGPWWTDEWFNDDVVQFERGYCVEQRIVNESPIVDHSGKWVCLADNETDARLIADAPLLLEEVKRLREQQQKILRIAETNMAVEWGDTDAYAEWAYIIDMIKGDD
tara:strand:- start:1811 stop:2161 length:351 start_codon:yes stop_codon:yes gene_type:complete